MPIPRPPRQLPAGFVGRFFAGMRYPFEGLAFIKENGLWRVSLWIILIDVAVFAALVAAAIALVKPILVSVGSYVATTFAVQSQFAAGLVQVLTWVIWTVVIFIAIGLSGVALVLVGQALASPFLDALSETIERCVLGTREMPLGASRVTRAVVVALGDLVWGSVTAIAVYVPLFLIGLIPGVGTVPASIASYLFGAVLAAHEFVGLPLTRRFVSYRGRWRVVWDNAAVMLGFGTMALLLLVVPGTGFVMLPFAAAGGTLLYCDLVASGRLKDHVDPATVPILADLEHGRAARQLPRGPDARA
jgi:CysZ protein